MSTTSEHAELRRRHFAELQPHHWRNWDSAARQNQFVRSHLRDAGYAASPVRWVDWPGGWFVEFDTGLVVFVSVRWLHQGCAAQFYRDIVELQQPAAQPPTVAEVIGGAVVAVVCLFGLPYLGFLIA